MQHFRRKIAIVTGGASGIGEATARALCNAGAIVIIADIAIEQAKKVALDLKSGGGFARAYELDMGDHPAIECFARDVINEHGGIDFVVNNAVRTDPDDGAVADIPSELWSALLGANLIGPAMLSRHCISSMIERGSGAFVHIASAAGFGGEDARTCYGVAKAGLMGLSRSIAVQYGKLGVTSNCIAPGLILTPAAAEAFDADAMATLERIHMTGGLGAPEDIAAAVLFLLSPAARFISGHTLVADGGMTAALPTVSAFRSA